MRFDKMEPGRAVLRYVSDSKFAGTRLGITFPPGCITLALYEEGKSRVFWAIYSPDAELLGYFVHICRDITIAENEVDQLDLLLDIWFYPDGRHIILDEDEVAECHADGRLTPADHTHIQSAHSAALASFEADALAVGSFTHALESAQPPDTLQTPGPTKSKVQVLLHDFAESEPDS